MTRTGSRAQSFTSAVLGACLCVSFSIVTLLLVFLLSPGFDIPINRDLSGFVRGFYPTEGSFVWTQGTAAIRLDGFSRRTPWRCAVVFYSACPLADRLPLVTFSVDGRELATVRATNADQVVSVSIPSSSDATDLALTISASPTFVPGPADPRELGIAIRSIRFSPDGPIIPLPGRRLLLALLGIAGALGGCLGYVLASGRATALFAGLAGSGLTIVLSHAASRYVPAYLGRMTFIGVSIAVVVIAMIFCLRAAGRALSTMDRRAIASATVVAVIEIALLLHPYKPDMDDTMHVHRYQSVLVGNSYMTETGAGGYVSPRAIGFYLFASLFRWATTDVRALMQVLTVVLFAIASLAIYAMIKRSARDETWAYCAAVGYLMSPVMMNMHGRGTYAHLFAYNVIVLALFCLVHLHAKRSLAWGAMTCLLIVVSYLSHLAVVIACTPLLLIIAAATWREPSKQGARFATYVLAATLGGAGIAYLAYYAHFNSLYVSQLRKIFQPASAEAAVSPQEDFRPRESSELTPYAPGGRSIGLRARSVPFYALQAFGFPLIALAALGAVLMARSWTSSDLCSRMAVCWLGGAVLLIILAVVSPLDTRPYFIMMFGMACAAGRGAAYLLGKGRVLSLCVIALAIVQAYFAVQASWFWLI